MTSVQSLYAVMIFAFVEALNKIYKSFIWNRFAALGVLKTFSLECLEFAGFQTFDSAMRHHISCFAGIS